MITTASFELSYEDPTLSVRGLERLKQALSNGCRVSSGPSWVVASCSAYVVKVRVILPADISRIEAPRSAIVVVFEGDSDELVRFSGLLLSIAKETGGGILMV